MAKAIFQSKIGSKSAHQGWVVDSAGTWRGTWVVTSGTGGLEGLEARGSFWGPGWLPPDGGSDECPEGMGVVYYSVAD